jgi:hypothetical protein
MREKFIKLLLSIAHLSEKASALAEELDKMYDLIGDQAFIDMLEKNEEK